MAGKSEELNTRLTATDQASKVVDGVADKLEQLEATDTDTKLTATDEASDKVTALDKRLDGLSDEDRTVVLKAQATQAQREVDQLTKRLADASRYDNDEIKVFVEERGNAQKRLDQIQSELRSIDGASPEIKPEVDSSALDGLIAKIGKIGSAAGIGALLGVAIEKGMDARQGVQRLVGQFRITVEEAAKYGKLAGEIYADNWGESLREVQQAVALTAQRLNIETQAELREVTAGVFAVTDTWEQEFAGVVRSISQLMENGLAGSATEALDLVTAAFQAGGDEAGDLLDTIDEYSQHWGALGISGEEAMNQIIAGLQQGQRDTDKLADAVKEFRLRAVDTADAVSEAYASLGLDADDYRQRILAGGETARDAFLEVVAAIRDMEDPIEQHKAAVALLGTQYEDLGPKALDALLSIEGQLGEVTTATEDLGASIEATPWEELQRRGESALGALGTKLAEVALLLIDLIDKINNPGGNFEGFGEWEFVNGDLVRKGEEAAGAAKALGTSFHAAADEARQAAPTIQDVATAASNAATAASEFSLEINKASTNVGEVKRKGDTWIETLHDVGSESEYVGRSLDDIGESAGDAAGALSEMDQAAADLFGTFSGESTLLDLADQFDSVRESAEDAWKATEGNDEDAAAKRRDHRQDLLGLIENVGSYLLTLKNVPTEVKTSIIADIDANRLNDAAAKLAELQEPGHKQIFVDLIDRSMQGKIVIGASGTAAAPTFTPRNTSAPQMPAPSSGTTYNITPPQSPSSLAAAQKVYTVRNGIRPG